VYMVVPCHNFRGYIKCKQDACIRGSGSRFVKFSNGPNTNSECSNLLN
jgi:hypothetical protein